jgi:hypothetical protein
MPEEYTIQVSTRVTLPEREAVLEHGGLAHIVRKFLKDNASGGEEKLIGGLRVLDISKADNFTVRDFALHNSCGIGGMFRYLSPACLKTGIELEEQAYHMAARQLTQFEQYIRQDGEWVCLNEDGGIRSM